MPIVLVIRDGWGINPGGEAQKVANGDATLLGRTPFHDHLVATYPQSRLSASGLDVGLPVGQMGNSEVGHLNLGAGRIVYQDLTRINQAINTGEFARNPALLELLEKTRPTRLHLLGLVSDGGVHSHEEHLFALIRIAHERGVRDLVIHAITDGRDTSPTGGANYLQNLAAVSATNGARIGTVVGRYYAMDRDRRWERTALAWDAIVHGRGDPTDLSPSAAVRRRYEQGETDEFLTPLVFGDPEQSQIRDGDSVLFFNFRGDRARQMSRAFLYPDFQEFDRGTVPRVNYGTLTRYEADFPCPVMFEPQVMTNILGEVVSAAGRKQLRIAETEKYPHVTYFFNGGIETPNPGEERVIVPSPKVATYDLAPEMSAAAVTREVVARLADYDLVILNFANPDMVGHTGVVDAAVKAVEVIDDSVRQVIEETLRLHGQAIVTADHGNCEQMRNPDGSPNTAHTTNLVQCFYVAPNPVCRLKDGILADVAPTLLQLLGIQKPVEMTGQSLLTQ